MINGDTYCAFDAVIYRGIPRWGFRRYLRGFLIAASCLYDELGLNCAIALKGGLLAGYSVSFIVYCGVLANQMSSISC